MDRHLFDIIWEVYRDVDGKKPIQIVSAYRSPATNAMLHRRSKGVARFSQHMLGHAMDFFIPDVPLEQIRFAGLRLQRGGVGFYPTSGSPFVHLDTGNIRHWPRMTHDQLAKVFPDGRTVHIPTDGVPLKGYELARAEIDKRGDGDDAATMAHKPEPVHLLVRRQVERRRRRGRKRRRRREARCLRDRDAGAGQVGRCRAGAARQAARSPPPSNSLPPTRRSCSRRSRSRSPRTRLRPAADARRHRQRPRPLGRQPVHAEAGDAGPVVAAISARQALEAADPRPTSSVPAAYQAMAYAPQAAAPVDHANVVSASAPIPRSPRPVSLARNSAPATGIDTVATKGAQGDGSLIATSTRLTAATNNGSWMRVVLLAPSATTSMSVTMMGDADLTVMRAFFVKPQAAIAMSFSDDPMMGMDCDHFSGSATIRLETVSFGLRTALLH